eukprot:comp11963_c0_seq2/m.6654 comp11963_c0_seq2/g.6654  ORF comp11963_c0_seq2/g.6654 comp11963_c0_seq2/m.6654 type:complete len:788 (-) comp11963_c0_seq2:24-2387(-)
MSRIIVKNLPKHITEERVREHFAQKGEVTDVKLKYTSEGRFRRFCFVGYRTAKSAQEAVNYFKNTYIDTSKIEVDLAKTVNDPSLERPWSRYSEGSSAHAQKEAEKLRRDADAKRKEEEKKKEEEHGKKQREAAKEKKAKAVKMLADIYGVKDMEDPELQEFLEVSKPRAAAKTWSNEDTALQQAQKIEDKKAKKSKLQVKVDTVDAKRPAVAGTVHTRTHITFNESDAESDTEYQDLPAADDEDSNEGAENEEKEVEEDEENKTALAPISDMDYFKAKMTLKDDDGMEVDENEEDEFEDEDIEEEEEGTKKTKQKKKTENSGEIEMDVDGEDEEKEADEESTEEEGKQKGGDTENKEESDDEDEGKSGDGRRVGEGGQIVDEQSIAETGRLFVRNLPYTCTEEDLTEAFSKFGPLAEVHMPLDRETLKPKGLAYVTYVLPEHAVRAFESMDAQIFQGRLLHILPAHAKAEKKKEPESKTFKGKKEQQKKADAELDYNWNSLFMRSDTVAAALAEKLKVAKSDILSRDADSMAVRMALGETHIIQETKQYLQEEGVRLEAFERKGKTARSKTVIIVKNVPFEVSEDELRAVFGKHGDITRVVLPPTKTISLLEFVEPSQARMAFRSLAYSKFKTVPLYLEWAPEDVFEGPYDPEKAKKHKEEKEEKDKAKDKDMEEAEENDGAGHLLTVFVKNLNFDTTEETLKTVFAKAGKLRAVRVAKKKDMKNPGKMLSMGFGFVEYKAKEGAQNALKMLQHIKVDGHVLELKISKNQGAEKKARRYSDLNGGF